MTGMEADEELVDYFDTFEKSKARLEAIEATLAARFGLTGDVRAQLREMDLENRLVEDRVVADWHCALSWHIHGWNEDGSPID